jgi:CxxC motif-containing protein (DUF1111 family)
MRFSRIAAPRLGTVGVAGPPGFEPKWVQNHDRTRTKDAVDLLSLLRNKRRDVNPHLHKERNLPPERKYDLQTISCLLSIILSDVKAQESALPLLRQIL